MADLVIKPKVRHFSMDDRFVIDSVNRGGFRPGEHRSVLQRRASTSEEYMRDCPRSKLDFEMLSEQTLLRCKFFHPPVDQQGDVEIIESSLDQTVLSKTTLYGNPSVPVFKVYTETVTSVIQRATGDQLLDFEKTKNEPAYSFDPGTGRGGADVFPGTEWSVVDQASLREIPISEQSGRYGEFSDDVIELGLPPPGRGRRSRSKESLEGSEQTTYSRAGTPLSSAFKGALQLATDDLSDVKESATDSAFLDPVSPFYLKDAKHRWEDTDEQYQQTQEFFDSMPPGTSSSVPPQTIGVPDSLSTLRMPDPDESLVTYGSTQENIPIALPWHQDDDLATNASGSAGFPSDIATDVSESDSLGRRFYPQQQEILFETDIESPQTTPRSDVKPYFEQLGSIEDLSPIPLDQNSALGRIRATEHLTSKDDEAELRRLLYGAEPTKKPSAFTSSTPAPLRHWQTIPSDPSRSSESDEPPMVSPDYMLRESPENLRFVPTELHPYLEPMKDESAHVDSESDLPDDSGYPQVEDDVFAETHSAPDDEQISIASPRTPPPTPDLEGQTDKEFSKDSEAADSEKPSSSDESKEREKTWKLQWSDDIIVIPISNSPSKEGNLDGSRLKRMESVAKQVLKLEKKVIETHRLDAKVDKHSATTSTSGGFVKETSFEQESSESTGSEITTESPVSSEEAISSPETDSSTTVSEKEPDFVEPKTTGYDDVVRDADLLSQDETLLSFNHEDLIAQSMMELDSEKEKQRCEKERKDGEKINEDLFQPPIKSTAEAPLTADSVPKESVVVEESHAFYEPALYRRVQSRDQLSLSLDSEHLAGTQRSAEDTDVFIPDDSKLRARDKVELVSSVTEPSQHLESQPSLEISSDHTHHSPDDVSGPITNTTSENISSVDSDTLGRVSKELKEVSENEVALLKKRSKDTPSLDLDLEGADVVAMATDVTDGKIGDSYSAETAATIDEIKKEVSETSLDVNAEALLYSADDVPPIKDIAPGEISSDLDFVGQRAAVTPPMCPSINVSPTPPSTRLPVGESIGVDVPTSLTTSPSPEINIKAAKSLSDSIETVLSSTFGMDGYPLSEEQRTRPQGNLIQLRSPTQRQPPDGSQSVLEYPSTERQSTQSAKDYFKKLPPQKRQLQETDDSESMLATIAAASLDPVDQPEQQSNLFPLESVDEDPILLDNVVSDLFTSIDQDEQNFNFQALEAQEEKLSSNNLPVSLFPHDQPEQPLPPPEFDALTEEQILAGSVSDIFSEKPPPSDQQPEEAFVTTAASHDYSLPPPPIIPPEELDPSPVDAQFSTADQGRSLRDLQIEDSRCPSVNVSPKSSHNTIEIGADQSGIDKGCRNRSFCCLVRHEALEDNLKSNLQFAIQSHKFGTCATCGATFPSYGSTYSNGQETMPRSEIIDAATEKVINMSADLFDLPRTDQKEVKTIDNIASMDAVINESIDSLDLPLAVINESADSLVPQSDQKEATKTIDEAASDDETPQPEPKPSSINQ